MDRLAEEAVAGGDFEKALLYGLQLTALSPRTKARPCPAMRCFAALGQRARALERYDALAAHRNCHLGIGPTQQTIDLVRELRGESRQ